MVTMKKSIWGWIWTASTFVGFLMSCGLLCWYTYEKKFGILQFKLDWKFVEIQYLKHSKTWHRILLGCLGVTSFICTALLATIMAKAEFLVDRTLVKLSPLLLHGVLACGLIWPVWDDKKYFVSDALLTFIVFALFWKVEAFRPYRAVKEQNSLQP